MKISIKKLNTGWYHIKGVGPANWTQPPTWPASEDAIRQNAFPQASETFLKQVIAMAEEEYMKADYEERIKKLEEDVALLMCHVHAIGSFGPVTSFSGPPDEAAEPAPQQRPYIESIQREADNAHRVDDKGELSAHQGEPDRSILRDNLQEWS